MLILASASPRRKELLKKITPDFLVLPSNVDESVLSGSVIPSEYAKEESRLKAYDVFSKHKEDEVLSCDTIVVLEGRILGKPKNEEDAFKMLRLESGKPQIVLSAYTYISKEKEITRTVSTKVFFRDLTDEEIRKYIALFQPLDKAGSYGIQDPFPLIERIEGSFDNVMGLPVEDLRKYVFPYSPKSKR